MRNLLAASLAINLDQYMMYTHDACSNEAPGAGDGAPSPAFSEDSQVTIDGQVAPAAITSDPVDAADASSKDDSQPFTFPDDTVGSPGSPQRLPLGVMLSSDNVPMLPPGASLASLKYRSPEVMHGSGQTTPSGMYSPGPGYESRDSPLTSRPPTPTFSDYGDDAGSGGDNPGHDTFQFSYHDAFQPDLQQLQAAAFPPPLQAAANPLPQQPASLEGPPPLTYPAHATPHPQGAPPPRRPAVLERPPPLTYPLHATAHLQRPPPTLQPPVLQSPPPLLYPRQQHWQTQACGDSQPPSDCSTGVPAYFLYAEGSAPHYGGFACHLEASSGGAATEHAVPAPHETVSCGYDTAPLQPPPPTAQAPSVPLTAGLAATYQVNFPA